MVSETQAVERSGGRGLWEDSGVRCKHFLGHFEACVLDSKFSAVVFAETEARVHKGKARVPMAAAGERSA